MWELKRNSFLKWKELPKTGDHTERSRAGICGGIKIWTKQITQLKKSNKLKSPDVSGLFNC